MSQTKISIEITPAGSRFQVVVKSGRAVIHQSGYHLSQAAAMVTAARMLESAWTPRTTRLASDHQLQEVA